MNKNKIIFAIIWVIIIILMFLAVLKLRDSWNTTENKSFWLFSIWIVWDDVESAKKIVDKFKIVNPEYKSQNIIIESFSTYDDYNDALNSAIIQWKAPDLFVLNNNEKNWMFSNQVVWINKSIINPNDFRKKYKWVFADDLIISTWEWEEKQEFLAWIPVWYESLWIFYNRRYIKEDELSSLSWLNNVVADLKEKKPSLVPIWMWNGTTVAWVSDIITQFFMLENWVSSLEDVTWTKMKQWLSSYLLYWDVEWYNGYNSRFLELTNVWKDNIDLFSKWETFMVVGYPRLIMDIADKWFSKNFLLATKFPHYYSGEGKTLINYNYFVKNKESLNQDLANAFLKYLYSDIWAEDYLSLFKYYLPALLSLESDKLEEKISDDYNIVLNDFYSNEHELSSFDKWVKRVYDKNIVSILDNTANYESWFESLRRLILCKAKKISTLEWLSKSCE